MLRLDRVIQPWKDAAALCDHINLYGFWNETAFLTKSGDLGMVLRVGGVDYESLDRAEQEYAVKRLEAALKAFGPGFHVYQYLFKSNRPEIPFARYKNPIVQESQDFRKQHFEAKADSLFEIEIYYCILLEGARSKTGVRAALGRLFRDPAGAVSELKGQFTNNGMKTLLRLAAASPGRGGRRSDSTDYRALANWSFTLTKTLKFSFPRPDLRAHVRPLRPGLISKGRSPIAFIMRLLWHLAGWTTFQQFQIPNRRLGSRLRLVLLIGIGLPADA
jgi:hypothetical protein